LIVILIVFLMLCNCWYKKNNKNNNIALCFCVSDCEKYLPKIFENIERVKKLNFNVYSIFIYDNCSDDSPNLIIFF
jgi:hypothetical protein